MDIWVVAAAAGAGYIAQHWKDLIKGGQNISESSYRSSFLKPELSSSGQHFQDRSCIFRRLGPKKNRGKEVSEARDVSHGVSQAEVDSTNGLDDGKLVKMDSFEDCNLLSHTCVSPRFLSNGDCDDFSENLSDLLLKPSTSERGSLYNRRIIRSKRINGQVIKPLNSLESCLMAQLYKEHAEIEEYMLSSVPSPSTPTVRPLLVTDGSRIISRASGQSLIVRTRNGQGKWDKETGTEEKGTIIGVPPLPKTGRSKEIKTRDRDGRLTSLSKVTSAKYSNSQGSSYGALLFCLGISFGIISSFMSNKREVNKLNDLLKQTEDLVQDLQEELDMKGSLTVKELALEDYESQDTQKDTYRKEENFESTEEHKEDRDQNTKEESMRKIEVELEAELARLELNMTSSTVDGQLSDLVGLDPDSVPDMAEGELRADLFRRQAGDQPYADRDGSGTSTPRSINYAVSPRELTLRLHELLESRLEQRVKELESALRNRGMEVPDTEPEHMRSWRDFSNSEAGSSHVQESPFAKKVKNLAEQPVVIHLAGDALHAYNEAYDEFRKIDWSEDEGAPSVVENDQNDHQERVLHNFDQDLHWIPSHSTTNRSELLTFVYRGEEDQNVMSSAVSTSGHEDDDGDDEMEKLLIKQILEKSRQGSPAVLNARKILFSMDENEH